MFKTFNALKFLQEYDIPYYLEGKNINAQWIGIQCPFCNDPSTHGGFSPRGHYNCWRCGQHTLQHTIQVLVHSTNRKTVQQILNEYSNISIRKHITKKKESNATTIVFPTGTKQLTKQHQKYLEGRMFDPEKLTKEYGLLGTGPFGAYKHRIIAPIYTNNKLVSYQGRDITGQSFLPYKACSRDKEIIHHKDTLYAIDLATRNGVIVVEGITDAWRMGRGAVATFGVNYTKAQLHFLATRFKQVFVLFDSDNPAIQQSERLSYELAALGVSACSIHIEHGDPANLSDTQAQELKKDLIGENN